MVVRLMDIASISQCDKDLDFQPRSVWPAAMPALAWKGQLLGGFSRSIGAAVDLFEIHRAPLLESLKACYPELGLAEIARLSRRLAKVWPETFQELRSGFFLEYGLRGGERLEQTLEMLVQAPPEFQEWVDAKKCGPRDLSPLLALKDMPAFSPFLSAMTTIGLSRAEGARALELGVELFLMGRPLSDILPTQDSGVQYLRQLEKWRRPETLSGDEQWRDTVSRWPWPAQVQASWQRFGDQSGLEVKLRATSPQDFNKKLERMLSIGDTWNDRTES